MKPKRKYTVNTSLRYAKHLSFDELLMTKAVPNHNFMYKKDSRILPISVGRIDKSMFYDTKELVKMSFMHDTCTHSQAKFLFQTLTVLGWRLHGTNTSSCKWTCCARMSCRVSRSRAEGVRAIATPAASDCCTVSTDSCGSSTRRDGSIRAIRTAIGPSHSHSTLRLWYVHLS